MNTPWALSTGYRYLGGIAVNSNLLDDEYLRPSEVAAIVRKNPTTIRRWIKLGLLPAARLPGHPDKANYLIRREDVEKMLEVRPLEQLYQEAGFVESAEESLGSR